MERAMKNVAEFTIIGRVGAIKTLGKAVRVTIASNYRLKDERGTWRLRMTRKTTDPIRPCRPRANIPSMA